MCVVCQLMWSIVTQKFESVIETCELVNWREALAVVLTYAAGEEFNRLCGLSVCLSVYARNLSPAMIGLS